jgi:hypothetical protein
MNPIHRYKATKHENLMQSQNSPSRINGTNLFLMMFYRTLRLVPSIGSFKTESKGYNCTGLCQFIDLSILSVYLLVTERQCT